jgi:hypothetical protein
MDALCTHLIRQRGTCVTDAPDREDARGAGCRTRGGGESRSRGGPGYGGRAPGTSGHCARFSDTGPDAAGVKRAVVVEALH